MTGYYLGLYWGLREESAEDCALRLQKFLLAVHDLGTVFSRWGETGWTRAEAMKKGVDPEDLPGLIRIVEEGAHRDAEDGPAIDGLGFVFGLWNMRDDEKGLSLIVNCAMSESVPGLGGNCVTLNFADELITSLGVDTFVDVLRVAADAWRPDWGGVFSGDSVLEQQHDLERPFVEWLLYLGGEFATVGRVEAPSRVVPLEDFGTIVVVQDALPQPSSGAHRTAVSAVKRSLHLWSDSQGSDFGTLH